MLENGTERFFGPDRRYMAVVHNGRVYVSDANQRGREHVNAIGLRDYWARQIVDWRASRFNSWQAFFRFFAGSEGVTAEDLEPIEPIQQSPDLPGWVEVQPAPVRRLDKGADLSIADIKRLAKAAGSHFFDRGAMRFFDSRILRSVYQDQHDPYTVYFVTSEQFHGSQGSDPRAYSVRRFCRLTADVETVGAFQSYSSPSEARAAAKAYAAADAAPVDDPTVYGFSSLLDLYGVLVRLYGYDNQDMSRKFYYVEAAGSGSRLYCSSRALEEAIAYQIEHATAEA